MDTSQISFDHPLVNRGRPRAYGVLIPGVALFGTPYFGNSRRFETPLEIEDGILFQRKRHLIQVGAGVNRIALRTQVLDGSRGLFVFPTLATLTSGSADFFTQSFGAPTQTWPKSA